MPRMQVYLPDDLYEAVKTRGLSASELLQKAVRSELRRINLLAETDRYLARVTARVGKPGPRERAAAKQLATRIAGQRAGRKAG